MTGGDHPHVQYAGRRSGMDHDRYDYRALFDVQPPAWPNGAGLAIALVVSFEWFRFDQQRYRLAPLGDPVVEYPDFWGWTRLDYGNRVGAERVIAAIAERSLPAAAAVNSALTERYPHLVRRLAETGWEIVGHGTTSSLVLHEGIPEDEERTIVREALGSLREATSQPVRGWLSPSLSESTRTLDLLAEAGVEYVLDWVNDDYPYAIRTPAGALHSLPYSYELNDLHVIASLGQPAWDYSEQVLEQARVLARESEHRGARAMALPVHPWVLGAPLRIGYLEGLLDSLAKLDVWWATPGQIREAYETETPG